MSPTDIFVMADNRPPVYVDDLKRVVYRASSVGTCPTKLIAYRLELEEDGMIPQVEKYMNLAAGEGRLHEDAIVETLRQDGILVHSREQRCTFDAGANADGQTILIAGHIDGLEDAEDGRQGLVELKTMSTDRFKKWRKQLDEWGQPTWENFDSYAWQVSTYFACTDADFIRYVVKNRNTGEVFQYVIDKPPYTAGQIKNRIAELEARAKLRDIPPCSDKASQAFCPFQYLHGSDDGEPFDLASGFEEELDPEFQQLVEAARLYKDNETAYKKMYEITRKQLIEKMGKNAKMITGEGWKVTTSTGEEPRKGRLNNSDLEEFLSGLEGNVTLDGFRGPSSDPSTRLTIMEPGENT